MPLTSLYFQNPGIDIGDVSERRALRKSLKCKNFQWYLDHVYPEMRRYNNTIAYGEVIKTTHAFSLDSYALGWGLLWWGKIENRVIHSFVHSSIQEWFWRCSTWKQGSHQLVGGQHYNRCYNGGMDQRLWWPVLPWVWSAWSVLVGTFCFWRSLGPVSGTLSRKSYIKTGID